MYLETFKRNMYHFLKINDSIFKHDYKNNRNLINIAEDIAGENYDEEKEEMIKMQFYLMETFKYHKQVDVVDIKKMLEIDYSNKELTRINKLIHVDHVVKYVVEKGSRSTREKLRDTILSGNRLEEHLSFFSPSIVDELKGLNVRNKDMPKYLREVYLIKDIKILSSVDETKFLSKHIEDISFGNTSKIEEVNKKLDVLNLSLISKGNPAMLNPNESVKAKEKLKNELELFL